MLIHIGKSQRTLIGGIRLHVCTILRNKPATVLAQVFQTKLASIRFFLGKRHYCEILSLGTTCSRNCRRGRSAPATVRIKGGVQPPKTPTVVPVPSGNEQPPPVRLHGGAVHTKVQSPERILAGRPDQGSRMHGRQQSDPSVVVSLTPSRQYDGPERQSHISESRCNRSASCSALTARAAGTHKAEWAKGRQAGNSV